MTLFLICAEIVVYSVSGLLLCKGAREDPTTQRKAQSHGFLLAAGILSFAAALYRLWVGVRYLLLTVFSSQWPVTKLITVPQNVGLLLVSVSLGILLLAGILLLGRGRTLSVRSPKANLYTLTGVGCLVLLLLSFVWEFLPVLTYCFPQLT